MHQEVELIGNLGRDPEMRYLADGTPVTTLSVATNRKWDGGEETVWWRVTCWRKLAEVVAQYLSKGRQVFIKGRMTPDKATGGPKVFQKKDGTWGASYEVTADKVTFLGGRGETVDISEQMPKVEDDPFAAG